MKKTRILIVEDERIVAEDIKTTLEQFGYDVCGLMASGAEALARMGELLPDLIMMDIVLKGELNGIETAEKVRSERSIPVVYLTAYGDDATIERAKLTEPYGYIMKPFNDRELCSVIETALYKHGMDQKLAHLNAVLLAIRNVNQLITKETDRDRLIQGACDNLIETLGYYNAWITIFNESGKPASSAYAGFNGAFAPMTERLARGELPQCGRKALDQAGVVIVKDPSAECSDCPLAGRSCGWTGLSSRLEYDGNTYGLLTVSVPTEFSDDSEEQDLFREVADDIAFALRKIAMEEEREQAEDALGRERAQAQRYLDIAGVMFVALDGDGNVTLINRKGCEILGYPEEEIVGKNWFDHFLPPKIRKSILSVSHTLMEKMKGGEYHENPVLARDGEECLIAWRNVPLHDEHGNVTGHLSSGMDVTEQRIMEAQLRQSQKLESIGTLAGGVAHEINNPIMGIMNYAQLIQDGIDESSPLREYASEIMVETDRVATIVKNLLGFARQDKQEDSSSARMTDIVNGTLSLITTVMRHDQITLTVDVPDDLPQFKCRSQQIQQVLMNLLTNARDTLNEKYEGQDEDKIVRISARVIADCGSEQVQRSEPTGSHIRNPKSEIRNRYVRLTVEDHGNGIPPEVLERMFEPFFTTKPKDKGTGLGLSIIHGIVKDHGGKLSVESKPGRWTRVHVDLPNAECGLRIAEPEEAEIGSGGLPCG